MVRAQYLPKTIVGGPSFCAAPCSLLWNRSQFNRHHCLAAGDPTWGWKGDLPADPELEMATQCVALELLPDQMR